MFGLYEDSNYENQNGKSKRENSNHFSSDSTISFSCFGKHIAGTLTKIAKLVCASELLEDYKFTV
jgi:hypothetical protein